MDDSDYVCPLCCEELDISDRQFFPCKCGYQVCMWCWHRIRESESGLCPACRTPYGDDPHEFSAVDVEEVLKANKEKEAAAKRERDRLRQQSDNGASSDSEGISALTSGNQKGQMEVPKDRTQLANMRVIRRNLVYAVGLPPSIASEDILRKPEYFGQYGKISKIVLNRSQTTGGGDTRRASASAYVTFCHKEDTLACILALDGFYMDGRNIRASYGTSKYCSAFIKNVRCNNPECTYLHQMGDVEDTFTKQEIQAGYVTSGRDVLARQQQIVAQALSASSGSGTPRRKAGGGGPSGTGRGSTTPVFPAPTYDEPAKSSTSTLIPPPASNVRSLTSGSAFPTISAANATQASSLPAPHQGKIVRSSSAGGLSSSSSSSSFPGPTPKGSIGSSNQAARKGTTASSVAGAANGGHGAAPMTMAAATAASVVAGVRNISGGSSDPPAAHTTLTPLTPLKRSNHSKGGKSSGLGGTGDPLTDLSMPLSKSLSASERTAFLEQRRDNVATMGRQQTEMATKLTSLRGGIGKKTRSGGSSPNSPSSIATGGAGTSNLSSLSSKHGSNRGVDDSVSSIGGSVIAAPGVVNGGAIGRSVVPVGGSVFDNPGPGRFADSSKDGLGGLGGEVFNGPLKSSGSKAAIGSGAVIGSGKDKWNSNIIGGDPVFPVNQGGLWTNGASSNGSGTHGLGSSGVHQGVGGIIGGTSAGTIGGPGSHSSGSSALASMLGINLPTGSGSLRESSNLWSAPAPAVQPPIMALNGSSVPVQGVIGPAGARGNNGLIGGVPIGGAHGMGGGSIGSGGNKSDIALLQSLLPGVHITSGSTQQHGSGFGTIGSGWGNSGEGNQPPLVGSSGLRLGEPHQGGHWNGGLQTTVGGAPVGPIGQGGAKQSQRQDSGSIW